MFEIKSPFLVFLITFIDVSQDEEFMQRKEKALKTVTDIFVSMLDFFLFMAKWVIFSNDMEVVNSVLCSQHWVFSREDPS